MFGTSTDGKSNLTGFQAVQRVRGDVSDMAQSAAQSRHGNERVCFGASCVNSTNRWRTQVKDSSRQTGTLRRLLATLKLYRLAARQQHVDEARMSSTHIRHVGLKHRRAFRSGYVDPLIAQTEGAAFGVNKARPFTNDAFAAES